MMSGMPMTITTSEADCICDPNYQRRSSSFHADELDKPYSDVYDMVCHTPEKSEIVCVNDDVDLLLDFLDYCSTDLDYKLLWVDLFQYDAVKCLTAILDGETKGLLDFATLVSLHQCEPLELAAEMGAHRLTKLLLARGDPDAPNLRNFANELPLNKALKPLKRWDKPTESIFLHLASCCRWDHRNYLETVRVLAFHTRAVQQEFIKYAMEGSVQEVAQLLLVAHEKVMPCVLYLRKQLLEKITSLLLHDATYTLTSENDYLTQKRMFQQVTLALFEIFERAGDKLSAYLRLPEEHCNICKDIENIFEGVGISIDDMDKFASNLYYRSLSELFMDQKTTAVLKQKGVTPVGGVYGLEGLLNPKVQGQLEESICRDDSHEFVNQMRGECLTSKSLCFTSELLRSICYHKSIACATALLERKTCLRIKLNTALEDGIYPLHLAAISLSPNLTQLFMRHGAHTDVQYDNSSSPYHGMFPLELALEALCHHRCVCDWTPTKSIYKLIYIFCLPELVGPLRTIRLLSPREPMLKKISSRCVHEGKFVELSALMMVSWYNLTSPVHDDVRSTFIDEHILSELKMLLNEESKLICGENSDGLQLVKQKQGGLLFAWSMLDILKVAWSAINDYRLSSKVKDIPNFEIPLDVSNLLRNAGLCLKINDVDVSDINCLLREVKSEQSGIDVAICSEKDEAHPAKPNIGPQSSNNTKVYEDEDAEGKGDKVYSPMYLGGGLCSLAPHFLRPSKIPKTKAFTSVSISIPPQTNMLHCSWPPVIKLCSVRQPTISVVATSKRWAFLASTTKKWARFV